MYTYTCMCAYIYKCVYVYTFDLFQFLFVSLYTKINHKGIFLFLPGLWVLWGEEEEKQKNVSLGLLTLIRVLGKNSYFGRFFLLYIFWKILLTDVSHATST